MVLQLLAMYAWAWQVLRFLGFLGTNLRKLRNPSLANPKVPEVPGNLKNLRNPSLANPEVPKVPGNL
jgi:hypothetical protein